ncbi:hemolysin C [Orientia chuto str. Dubai]|uniref:Hemolysin C n=1 Tax=Orientia chuto str. Dubai TaxID=1359168 RepID=A0A0F3MPY6_9RICK|nr:transporter associated domain-containing protein [Candidatus Orientia mediorientalis]KJV56654.1 hemolysin C [Orientia chuto str. Dubai]
MIPRSDIKAIKLPVTLDKLKSIITHTCYTRILVYENNLDTILGFVHIRDLLPILVDDKNFALNSILRQPIVAAQSMKVLDLLSIMQRKKIYISVIVDEYGGTDGIVTTEDIIEKIFDGIDQEDNNYSDARPEFTYQVVDQQTIITSARVKIETLEKVIGMQLKQEEDECNTIGGLVLTRIGYMPSIGFIVDINNNAQAEIIDATPRILKQIKLTIHNQKESTIL